MTPGLTRENLHQSEYSRVPILFAANVLERNFFKTSLLFTYLKKNESLCSLGSVTQGTLFSTASISSSTTSLGLKIFTPVEVGFLTNPVSTNKGQMYVTCIPSHFSHLSSRRRASHIPTTACFVELKYISFNIENNCGQGWHRNIITEKIICND